MSRPGDPYSCSVIMFGNIGPTKVEYLNTAFATVDIPGKIIADYIVED
jgi:hypothetical protein